MGFCRAGFLRDMRLSISRGLIPIALSLLFFPPYTTFVFVYFVFISLFFE